jgi:hypothetical protein
MEATRVNSNGLYSYRKHVDVVIREEKYDRIDMGMDTRSKI